MNSNEHDLVHMIRQAGQTATAETLEGLGFEPLFQGRYMGIRIGAHDLVYALNAETTDIYTLMTGEQGRQIARGYRAVKGAGTQ